MYDNSIPKPIIKGTRPASGNLAGKLKNIEWLRQHHQEYQGQWIALVSGQLLGANPNVLELYKAMANTRRSITCGRIDQFWVWEI